MGRVQIVYSCSRAPLDAGTPPAKPPSAPHAYSTAIASLFRRHGARCSHAGVPMRGLAPLRIVSACLWASCHRWQSSHIDMSMSRLVSTSPVGGTRVTSTEPGVRHAVRSQRQTSRRALAQEAGPCAPSAQDAAHHVLRCISERGGSAHAWCGPDHCQATRARASSRTFHAMAQ